MPILGASTQCLTQEPSEAGQHTRTPPVLPPPAVTVDAQLDGPRMRVRIRGEIDIDAGQMLRSALRHALARTGSGIDLDLSGVEFCDCSGLNILLALRRRALDEDKTVTLRASSPAVERLLDLTGAHGLFRPQAR